VNGWLEFAAFAGVTAVGQFSPGPDLLLVTRTALAKGGRAGAWTAAGIACGLILHSAVAMGGVSVLLMGDSPVSRVLRLAAGLYLVWIAFHLLRGAQHGGGVPDHAILAPAITNSGLGQPARALNGDGNCWRRGFFCNVLNPKVALFFAATAAPFLTPGHPPWWPWALGGLIVGQGFVLWVAWAWALQWPPLKRFYQQSARWIDAAFGVALLALAARVIAGLF
jgi:threonine/homoserine/homoserine lactone efflux protein